MSDLVGNPEDRFSHNEAQIAEQQPFFLNLVNFLIKNIPNIYLTTKKPATYWSFVVIRVLKTL